MIVGFSVSNFRSFLTEQSLSFLASSDSSHEASHCVRTRFNAIPRLTRTAVVFGANGSGKSNLLLALRVMREFVLFSTTHSQDQHRELYTPFASEASSHQPTSFHIDLLLNGLRYSYNFCYDAERVTREDLRVFRSRKSQRWFERQYNPASDSDEWEAFSPSFPGRHEVWRKATRSTALFLTTAIALKADTILPLKHWFANQLEIALASDITDLRPIASRLTDATYKRKVISILRAVDIPVTDVRVVKRGQIETHMGEAINSRIEYLYNRDGRTPMWIESTQDSSGAQRLVSLLSPLLDGNERDCFVAIDGFDAHLHPLLARFLVQMINNEAFTHRRVQVLLISQTTSLMDLDILRRDELWLLELDQRYASRLKTLGRQSLRKHEVVARAYLKGRYGAIPKLDADVLEILTESKPMRSARNG